MPDDRPYIEIEFTGTELKQSTSNTLNGTNIAIDYGDRTAIYYTGDYSHTYSTSGTYTIRIYGVTSLGESCFRGCSGFTSIIIPESVTSFGNYCFRYCTGLTSMVIPDSVTSLGQSCFAGCTGLTSVVIPNSVTNLSHYCFNLCRGLTNIQLNWTSSADIITYNSNWISNTNSSLVFSIPYGTTSLYSAKGYPTEKLVERSSNVSSYELFNDVKRLFLNNKEVKSIVIDETDGGIIYERTTTPIVLSADESEIDYGQNIILNGSIPFDTNSIKIYQDNVLIGTTFSFNGIFSYTVSSLNAGTYTFKAIFEGDESYIEGESNGIVVTVNKITPVLTLTSNKDTIRPGEIFTFSGTTTVNREIKIYNGSSLWGKTNSSSGTFSYNASGLYNSTDSSYVSEFYAKIDNGTNNNEGSSNRVSITVLPRYSTNLTIEVPTLIYSDTFDVTGILTDENNNPIPNASIKLYRDTSILEATATTNNNGEVTFHRDAPTSITTYDFQLKYGGNQYFSGSNSSIVTRVVNKETSILNIESPLNESTYTPSDPLAPPLPDTTNEITIEGSLSDNDGTPLSNKTILMKLEDTTLLTMTTDSEGNFNDSCAISNFNSGEHELNFVFNGDEFYTESIQTITINIEEQEVPLTPPSSLTLNASKTILSKYNNESCVLSALVTDENNNPCPNEIVTFLYGLHAFESETNENGIATYTYEGKDFGNIEISATLATLDNLSDSIIIEDCTYYNDGSSTNGLSINSGVSCSSDGEWITISTSTSGEKFVFPPRPLCCYTGNDNWELSFKCKTSDYSGQAFGLQMENCSSGSYSGDSQYTSYSGGFNNCMGAGYVSNSLLDTDIVTFKRLNGYWKILKNNTTEIATTSYNWSDSRVSGFYTNSGRIARLKEIKYKKIISNPNSIVLTSDKTRINGLNNESCTLSALLESYNSPVINRTVTFKAGDVILGEGTTDENGIATYVFEENTIGDYNITCECNSIVSNSLNITVSDGSKVFYYNSGADINNVSDFDIANTWISNNNSKGTITVESDGEEWITIARTNGSNYAHIPIVPLTATHEPFKLSCIVELIAYGNPYVASYSGFYACRHSGGYGYITQWGVPFRMCRNDKGSTDNWNSWTNDGNVADGIYKYEVKWEGANWTHTLYDLSGNVIKTRSDGSSSANISTNDMEFGIHLDNNRRFRIKEITAEYLY